MATILPDLLAIWRLQQAMVADIAAAFGKSAFLQKEAMVYCLFKHGGAAMMRDLVTRVGERYLIRRAALEAIQQVLQKMGVRVSQRVIGKSISRWLPVVGACGVGAYAYYDTTQVAANAIELFSRDLELEVPGAGIGAAAPSEDRDQTPEDGGQRSDVGGQRSEVGRQTSEGGGWKEG